MASPRRARSRVSSSSASLAAADVLMLGLRFLRASRGPTRPGPVRTHSLRSDKICALVHHRRFLLKHSPKQFALMFRPWPDRGLLLLLLAGICRSLAALACRQ